MMRAPLVLAASWADDGKTATSELAVVRAWHADWSRLSRLRSDSIALKGNWRVACVEAVSTRGPTAVGAEAEGTLRNRSLWIRSFGGAALPLLVREALRLNRRHIACAHVREALAQVRLPVTGGVAHVLRAIEGDALTVWLSALARLDYADADCVLKELLLAWQARHRWAVWRDAARRQIDPAMEAVVRLCRARAERLRGDPSAWQQLAIMEGLCGFGVRAAGSVTRFAAARGRAEHLPYSVAIGLTLRGCDRDARTLLERHTGEPGEPALSVWLRTVAWQLAGDLAVTERNLKLLQPLAAEFFGDLGRRSDAIWVWASVVMKRGGRIDLADALARRAWAINDSSVSFLDSVEPGADALARGWIDLLAPQAGLA